MSIAQHISFHRQKLRESGGQQRQRKVILAACLAELREENEYRESIELCLQALEGCSQLDFCPLQIGSEALRILMDYAMTGDLVCCM